MDDVDHDAGMVSINKTWDYKNDSGFMPTKTKSGSIISVVGKTTVEIIELFECRQKVP